MRKAKRRREEMRVEERRAHEQPKVELLSPAHGLKNISAHVGKT